MSKIIFRVALLYILVAASQAQLPPTQTCASTATPPSRYQHIVIFAFENRTWSNVGGVGFGDPAMPYLHSIAGSCSYFSDWTETNTSQNSLTQYIGETSGVNNPNTVNDCSPSTTCRSTDNNIFRQVRLAGGTPRNYVEGATSGCSASGNAAKHIPDLYYYGTYTDSSGVTHNDHDYCLTEVRPYSEFDVNNMPTYAFITPSLCNDGHDCGNSTVDGWASTNIQKVLNSADYLAGNTAVFVWYDEDHPTPNIQIAPTAHAGDITQTGIGTHAALLKTIELMLGLPIMQQGQLTTAADLRAITGLASTGGSTVSISISPTSATVASGGTQQFKATVTGSTNTAVTWSTSAGTISSTGLFTAPTATTTTTVTVKATSQADTTKSASATVTITPPSTSVAVTISPTSATVASGGTQQFTVTVTGTTTTAVTWSASFGTVSSGLYTAPTVSVNTTATVKATSAADPTKSARATVSITAPPTPVAISISPTSATVASGGTQQFTAQITNTTNTGVTWSASAGSISSSGFYTAATVTANSSAMVTATSVADPTKSASATVSITAPPPPVAVSISPTSATVASGGTQQFTAQITNTTNTAVTWSASAGTVSTSGLFTAPTVSVNTTASVKATSVADPTKSGTASITITPPPPTGTNPKFSLSATPPSQTVVRGSPAKYTITIAPLSGFTGSVAFAVTGLSGGARASFSPASVTVGTSSVSSTMTIDTGKGKTGTFTLTISASSGSITHKTPVSLTTTR